MAEDDLQRLKEDDSVRQSHLISMNYLQEGQFGV
jgi:hypothetical protein